MRLGLLFKDIVKSSGAWIYDNKSGIAITFWFLLVAIGIIYGILLLLVLKVHIGIGWWYLPVLAFLLAIVFTTPWEISPSLEYNLLYIYVKYFMSIKKAPLYINDSRTQIRELANKLLKKEL
jgi:hypothetical protein